LTPEIVILLQKSFIDTFFIYKKQINKHRSLIIILFTHLHARSVVARRCALFWAHTRAAILFTGRAWLL